MPKRKVSFHSFSSKYEALKKVEGGIDKRGVASYFSVSRNTLSTWLKKKDKIIEAIGSSEPGITTTRTKPYINKWFVKVREEAFP